ncbi:MAG: CapA family protein [Kineosporiaceae bacterium]
MPARRPLHTFLCALVATAALCAACSAEEPAPRAAAPAPSSDAGRETATSAPPPTDTPTSAPPTTAGTDTMTIALAGDVHFAEHVAQLLQDPSTSGLADLRPLLAGADLAMVNLETAITTRGTPQPKQFHFRTTPAALDALAETGVDVVTMANNHAVDYGPDGLKDSLAARASSPIPVVGFGKDEDDAYGAAMLDVRGVRVAVLGATQVPDWTLRTWPAKGSRPGVASSSGAGLRRLATAVRRARADADVVLVYLHWGTDYTSCPDAAQKRTADALAAAGADVVVGAHAHRVQGSGWRQGSYVAWGLGNFVWWRWRDPADTTTGVLTLTVRPQGRGKAARVSEQSWTPLRVRSDGVPRAARDDKEQADLDARRAAAQRCSGLSQTPPAG